MANIWLVYALSSCLLYGFCGFFSKLTTNYTQPQTALIYQAVGILIVDFFVLWKSDFQFQAGKIGIICSIVSGLLSMLGALFYLLALSKGKVAMVVTLTGLYPLISILLAFFILKEPITLRQGASVALVLAAIVLFSWSD